MARLRSARFTAVWFALGLVGTLILSLQPAHGVELEIARLTGT